VLFLVEVGVMLVVFVVYFVADLLVLGAVADLAVLG
jgi:hypothetical protein